MSKIYHRFAHRGVAMLRIAVLEVLYEAKKDNDCVGAAEISRRAEIFREPGWATKQGNDNIIWGVLNSLVKDEYVEKCQKPGGKSKTGWMITQELFNKRSKVIDEVPDWGGDKRIIAAYRAKQWGFCPACLCVLPQRPDVDHIKAKATGGKDTAENKQLLCPNCNRRRGKKPFEAFVKERLADGDEWTDYSPE